MESILGKFFNRIRGSQEDIASEGLVHILKRSNAARDQINNLVASNCGVKIENLNYSTQNTGENLERPDISGFDKDGNEVIIFEAKFWASLTENQPIEYLKRLKENGVLIFICPELRNTNLFKKLQLKLNTAQLEFTTNVTSNYLKLKNENQHLLVITWNQIIEYIKHGLIKENNEILLADLLQIKGFCDVIDSESFLPLADQDLSPKLGQRITSYYNLIDKTADELIANYGFNKDGLKATPQRHGYTRYIKKNNLAYFIELNFEYWAKHQDTPFWFGIYLIKDGEWISDIKMINKLKAEVPEYICYNNNSRPYFALFPKIDKSEDEIIESFCEQIDKIKV